MAEPSVGGSLVLLVWFPGLKSLSMAWRVTPPMSLLACSWGVWFFTELLAPMDHLSCPPDVGSQGLHCCFQPDEAEAAPLRAAEPVIPWQTRQSPGHRAGWDLSKPQTDGTSAGPGKASGPQPPQSQTGASPLCPPSLSSTLQMRKLRLRKRCHEA